MCRYDKSIISDAGIFLSGSQNTNISYSQLVLLEIQKKTPVFFLSGHIIGQCHQLIGCDVIELMMTSTELILWSAARLLRLLRQATLPTDTNSICWFSSATTFLYMTRNWTFDKFNLRITSEASFKEVLATKRKIPLKNDFSQFWITYHWTNYHSST